jgi:integrase
MTPLKLKRRRGRPIGQSDVLNVAEARRVLETPDRRTKQGLRDYAVLLLLLNTPMRKGELVSLTIGSMINEGESQFVGYKGLKKRSARPYWIKVPIKREVYDGIMGYVRAEYRRKAGIDDPLIKTLGKHGPHVKRGLTPSAVDGIVQKYVRLAGINKRVTPHSFRATYLTLRARDHDAMALLKLSGHADLGGITPYLRVTEEEKRAAALAYAFS